MTKTEAMAIAIDLTIEDVERVLDHRLEPIERVDVRFVLERFADRVRDAQQEMTPW